MYNIANSFYIALFFFASYCGILKFLEKKHNM
jgi:hypothetical protein